MKQSAFARLCLGLISAALLIAIYGPIAVTVAGAFLPVKAGIIQRFDPSLAAFGVLFKDQALVRSLLVTLLVGSTATVISVCLAMALALFSVERGGIHARVVGFIVFLPFVMPPMVTGLALLIYFRDVGIDRSLLTVMVGHVAIILAIAYRTLVVRLVDIGRSLIEASLDLGASRWTTFRRIILPNITGSLAASAALCFALSFDETLITLLLTGTESTFPVQLWGMTRLGITPAANAILAILLAVTVLMSAIAIRVAGRRGDSG
jgi:ABC-type spermidine/putrescine transport system permease subunit II